MLNYKNLLSSFLMPFFLKPQLSGLPINGLSPFLFFAEGEEGEAGGEGEAEDTGKPGAEGRGGKESGSKGKGSGAGDDHDTGEFDESVIPNEHRTAFKKYQQSLIDKGVDIGTARQKSAFEKLKGKEIDAYLKSEGLSKEDIASLKPILEKRGSLEKLFEAYDTDDLDEIVGLIEDAEDEELSEVELRDREIEKRDEAINDLMAQIEAIQNGQGEEKQTLSQREQKLLSQIENLMVNQQITNLASKKGAYDPNDVVNGVRSMVRLVEDENGNFTTQVIDPKAGHQRFNPRGEPYGIDSLVEEFLSQRPHLRKSDLNSGAGAAPGAGAGASRIQQSGGVGSKFTKEQLSDSSFVQKHYNEIQEAIRKGLIKF